MEASELRIGNFLDRNGKMEIYQIDGKSHNGRIKIYDHYNQCYINHWFDISTFKPIPLSEVWLLKLGFKKTDKTQKPSYYIGRDDKNSWNSFRIQYSTIIDINTMIETNGFIGLYLCNKYWCTIQYVHQLQNLYFALTEQELTLKENE